MKTIIVSGTPGTGKTALSKKLAKKLNYHYLDVNRLILKHKLSEGYDKKRKTKIVDVKKLNSALIKEINTYKKSIQSSIKTAPISKKTNKQSPITKFNKNKSIKNKKVINNKLKRIIKGIIIDSHLSHYLPRRYADLCIVTKCDLKTLKKRLKKKKYPESKIRENMDAEIFDICLTEAKENKHNVLVIDTTKGINIDAVSRKIGGLLDIKQSKQH